MQTANITILIFCYVMFFVQSWISKQNNNQKLFNEEGIFTSKPGNLVGSHIMGILWLGVVPLVLLKNPMLQILTGNEIPNKLFIISFILAYVIIIIAANKQSTYDYLRSHREPRVFIPLDKNIIASYFITRTIYLVMYEIFFRGFLLFECIAWLGNEAAVALNIILYVGVHIFNSKKEMLAGVPFGILVCFFSIAVNAVWPAVLLHLGFSLVYESNFYRSYLYSSKMIRL